MGLLALAIAPGLAICIFIYRKDRYNKEPLWMLILAFVLGILSIVPAIVAELSYGVEIEKIRAQGTMGVAFFAYCIVALSEEASKLLVLRLFIYPRKHFDDPFDGIVYAVMVGMGFATIENIMYVTQNGYQNGIIRMFLSVPAHATFAVLMGYFVGYAKFSSNKMGYFLLALLLPVIFHGSFDFFLFLDTGGLLALGAVVSLILALYLSFRAIRRKQELSRLFVEDNVKVLPGEQEPLK